MSDTTNEPTPVDPNEPYPDLEEDFEQTLRQLGITDPNTVETARYLYFGAAAEVLGIISWMARHDVSQEEASTRMQALGDVLGKHLQTCRNYLELRFAAKSSMHGPAWVRKTPGRA